MKNSVLSLSLVSKCNGLDNTASCAQVYCSTITHTNLGVSANHYPLDACAEQEKRYLCDRYITIPASMRIMKLYPLQSSVSHVR